MPGFNKVIIQGNLGKDPEIRSFSNGGKVANLAVATSESWNDKATGEKKEKTEWHKVVIKNESLVGVVEKYVKKGSSVLIEGQLETRKYEKDGRDVYVTEIIVKTYGGSLTLVGAKKETQEKDAATKEDPLNHEIPF